MKTYLIILIVLIILLNACAPQKQHYKKESFIHKIESGNLPTWVYELPVPGDYVVGIAQRSFDPEKTIADAREMATVIKCRNTGSYAIERFASAESSDIIKDGNVVFKLNVCSDPEEMQQIYEDLILVDEEHYYDFYIALFSRTDSTVANKYKTRIIANFPSWFEDRKIIDNEDTIITYARDSSSDLATAWERCAESARQQLAKYLEKDVLGGIYSLNDDVQKKINIETTRKLFRMEISRCFIQSEMKDALYSYKVYMEMTMVK